MKTLVVGASGFLGEAIARHLQESGDEVHRVVGTGVSGTRVWGYREGLYETLEPLLHDCGFIVYAAGSVLPRMETPLNAAFERDCAPLNDLLAAVTRAKSTATVLLLSSGGAVYGPRPSPTSCAEHDIAAPVSAYGLTRLFMEQSLRFHAGGARFHPVVFRLSNVYGPGQRPEGGSALILRALHAVAGLNPLPLWGNGDQQKDFLYVADVVAAVAAARQARPEHLSKDPIFNVAAGKSHSVREVLQIIERVTGRTVPTEIGDGPRTDVPLVKLSIEKAMQRLAWSPSVTLVEGVERYWRVVREQLGQR
jgi:UDP-glucose 4-epimerase